VELIRSIVSSSTARGGTPSTVETGGKLTLTDTALWEEGKRGDDPKFVDARQDWGGTGRALDSARYGSSKGYRSRRFLN
jgi:hypothetical protein